MSKPKPDTNYYAKKILKAGDAALTELEESVARAFVELEVTSKDLSGDLRDLFITSAKEIEVVREKEAERMIDLAGLLRSVPPPSGTTSLAPTAFQVIFSPSVDSFRCLRPRLLRPKSCL